MLFFFCSEGPEALATTKAMLNNIVGLLAKRLEDAGLLSREELQQQYALGPQGEIDCIFHMTLLNEAYRKRVARKVQQQERHKEERMHQKVGMKTFDATQLIKDMRGFDFGVVRVPSIQLNALSGGGEGGYKCLAHVDLP